MTAREEAEAIVKDFKIDNFVSFKDGKTILVDAIASALERRVAENHKLNFKIAEYHNAYEAKKQAVYVLEEKLARAVEALSKTEHFFAFPEEWDGPDQASLHCEITDLLKSLEGV